MCRCCYLIINVYRLQSYEEFAKECHLTRLNSVNGRIFRKKIFLRRGITVTMFATGKVTNER